MNQYYENYKELVHLHADLVEDAAHSSEAGDEARASRAMMAAAHTLARAEINAKLAVLVEPSGFHFEACLAMLELHTDMMEDAGNAPSEDVADVCVTLASHALQRARIEATLASLPL